MSKKQRNIIQIGLNASEKLPFLKPMLKFFYKKLIKKHYVAPSEPPKFSGWGMTTTSQHPWIDEFSCDIFRQSCESLQKFQFTPSTVNEPIDEYMYTLNYRHYFVSFCANYAINSVDTSNHIFVECGVNDGITAFFALNELSSKLGSNFKMHLYDSWAAMKKEHLLDSEIDFNEGAYNDASIDRTKSNLDQFKKNLIYHHGYIPDTFSNHHDSPNDISYLSVDLNSTKPTMATLEFFFSKLLKGGIIIFDDYGNTNYPDTKNAIDKFFSNKQGTLMKLPTGQAIYFN